MSESSKVRGRRDISRVCLSLSLYYLYLSYRLSHFLLIQISPHVFLTLVELCRGRKVINAIPISRDGSLDYQSL